MKTNLLFTTALVTATFFSSAVCSARQTVLPDGELEISSDVTNSGSQSEQGGAVLSQGKLTVADGVTFENNEGSVGGAVSVVDAEDVNVIGNDVTFKGNTSQMQGGALHNQRASTSVGDNAVFENNTAIGYGGGAVYQDTDSVASSVKIGDNAQFLNNKTEVSHGGAIMNFNGGDGAEISVGSGAVFNGNSAGKTGGAVSNFAGIMSLGENAEFSSNHADGDGGAIYNDNYGGNAEFTLADNAMFNDNTSGANGGAIANKGTMTINSAGFTNNSSTQNGGAIWNDASGVINMKGNNTFSGNTAAGKDNDIHNDGTINVSGNLTLDSGVSGSGDLVFSQDSALTVTVGRTEISNNVAANGADLTILIGNGWKGGDYTLVSGEMTSGDFSGYENKNNLYNITSDGNGTYNVTKKSTQDISDSLGANANQSRAIEALTSETSNNAAFNQVADAITEMLQSKNYREGLTAITAMSPTAAPVVNKTQTENANQVFNAVGSRLTGGAITTSNRGMSAGDNMFEKAAVWVEGLFGKSKLKSTSRAEGFDTDNYGVAAGIERFVDRYTKFGLGYAYTTASIDGDLRKIDAYSNTALLYSEYKPTQWYLNGIASYSWSTYKEKKGVAGYRVRAKYDVDTIALQAMTGYEMFMRDATLTPEAGVRYLHLDQKSYHDTIGINYGGHNSNIVTGIAGAKLGKQINLNNGAILKPEVRLAATYDFKTDKNNAVVALPSGVSYQVNGDRLKRLGWEVGAGVTTDVNANVELALGYEGRFRSHYQDHMGLVNAKYKF